MLLYQNYFTVPYKTITVVFAVSYCHLRIDKFGVAPKRFHWYVDDSHTRFVSRNVAIELLNVLNSQDPQIQYTIDCENDNKELNFLDVTMALHSKIT